MGNIEDEIMEILQKIVKNIDIHQDFIIMKDILAVESIEYKLLIIYLMLIVIWKQALMDIQVEE